MFYKTRANEVILERYKERGYGFAIDLSRKIMASQDLRKIDRNADSRNSVIGELCETALEVGILEFMRQNPEATRKWFYTKGLILKDLDTHDTDFLTEIDLVLFTPNKTYLFECKGYTGDKRIIKAGTIVRPGHKDFDVFKQHNNHANVFIKTFDSFRRKSVPIEQAYQLAGFTFAPGSLSDERSLKWKTIMPFLQIENLWDVLKANLSSKEEWLLDYAKKAVATIQRDKDIYIRKHLDYVTSLHPRTGSGSGTRRR